MTRIAVTGASGFVGRHLVPALQQEGHGVRCLVRAGSPGPGGTSVETKLGDVRDPEAVRSLVEGCEQVVHLASSFSPLEDAAEIVITGTQNLVSAARDAGVARIVYLSCLGAEAASGSPFYASKWTGEMLIRASDVAFTILRPSLVLGSDDGVVRPLAGLVRSWPVIPIPGRGQARHQPIDVEDLVRCIVRSLADDAVANESVSVGGTMFLTIRQLIDLLAGHVGVVKPKLLVAGSLLPSVARILPPPLRLLYSGPRLPQLEQDVVASPGIVERNFGFQPRSVVASLADYLS